MNGFHQITVLSVEELIHFVAERNGIILDKIPVPFHFKPAYELFIKPIYEHLEKLDLIIGYEAEIYTGDLFIYLEMRLGYDETKFVYRDYKVNERWQKARKINEKS